MNSIELFYQMFKLRYKLEDMNRPFVRPYRLALVGEPENIERMKEWMGEPTLCSGLPQAALECNFPAVGTICPELKTANVVICHLGDRRCPDAQLCTYLEAFSGDAEVLFLCEAQSFESDEPELVPFDASLPSTRTITPGDEEFSFMAAIFEALPNFSMRLARDYAKLRDGCVKSLINESARSMGLLAAASSVTVSLPVVGQLVGMLAVSAETFAITAAQLRLVLLIGALYGRPVDFFDRIGELWPVVGSAWGWRTAARELVGLLPAAGPVAKAAVAWSGTYFIGKASQRFYELGEHVPEEEMNRIADLAKTLADQACHASPNQPSLNVEAVLSASANHSTSEFFEG